MTDRTNSALHIALIGGGPSALFVFKRLIESGHPHINIAIFEARATLGAGMPYSDLGASREHVTNVSANEIPAIVCPMSEWIKTVPRETLVNFNVDPERFNEYKVLPRLLFGQYLHHQFELLLAQATASGTETNIYFNSTVTDLKDIPGKGKIKAEINQKEWLEFDRVVICTGHNWPRKNEDKVEGYFDSPYPPSKLKHIYNHVVAIKGASLTAIDAIRTLARQHGHFIYEEVHRLSYHRNENAGRFRIVMHSRNGLLPAIRFHLEDPHLSKGSLLSNEELKRYRDANGGFLSLDFIFENDFKEPIREKDPAFYARIKDLDMEGFVEMMMELREHIDPFDLFKGEYAEAEKSIAGKKSVYWKEMLAILSFAMNYPAKHFSAEDMLRLQKNLMPLISIVIAFVPQSSCEELIALYDAGLLSLIPVGPESRVAPGEAGGAVYHYEDEAGAKQAVHYETFIDCVGQPHLSLSAFPFQSLVADGTVSAAKLKFRSPEAAAAAIKKNNRSVEKASEEDYYLKVPGLAINDSFQAVDRYGVHNDRVYLMAVPYISGFNPDYSGLDFCEAASGIVVKAIFGI